MDTREDFLYENMQQLFYELEVNVKFDYAFGPSTNIDRIDNFFNELRTNITELNTNITELNPNITEYRGGTMIISLKKIKQYINETVNNITPK